MIASPSPAPSPPAIYRVVVLACAHERLVIAGGGVLPLAPDTHCGGVRAGRGVTIKVDADGVRVVVPPPGVTAQPASAIPLARYAIAPAAEASTGPDVAVVEIVVAVPARTPAGDDVYISTERGGWSPSELRMDRIDARRFRATLKVKAGARVVFRVTRGSFATLERDASRAVPPPHVFTAEPGAVERIDVAAWADVD